jgi:hypothetical protein
MNRWGRLFSFSQSKPLCFSQIFCLNMYCLSLFI